MYIYMYIYVCMDMFVCMYIYICKYVYMLLYVYMKLCKWTFRFTKQPNIYVQLAMCCYDNIYVYIYL
jgi:hypothetical protein